MLQCLYQSLRESFLDMRNWSSSSAIIFRPPIGQSSLCWLLIGQHWYRIRVQQSLHLHFYFSSRAPLCFVSDATKQCTLGNHTDLRVSNNHRRLQRVSFVYYGFMWQLGKKFIEWKKTLKLVLYICTGKQDSFLSGILYLSDHFTILCATSF